MLVDGDNFAAAERNGPSVFGQSVSGVEAFGLETIGLKGLKKTGKRIRFDGLRGAHEHAERTEVAIDHALFGNSAGAQAIVVRKIGGSGGGGAIGVDGVKPQDGTLNEIRGSEAVGGASLQRGIQV